MKSLKHPWALIGIPEPCYRGPVLGAAVTWHMGISSFRQSSAPVLGAPLVSHGWRKHGRIFPCLHYPFFHAGHLNSFGTHTGRQMCSASSWLQSWVKANLLWPRNCTNIHLTRAQRWTYLTIWIWNQCFFWATGRVACICLYSPMETQQGFLRKGSTLFSFRSAIVIRCKQGNSGHQHYNGTCICSFNYIISFHTLTTTQGWPPCGPVPRNGMSAHTAPQLAQSPLSPSICAHNKSTKNESAGNTQKELNRLPQPCCSAGLTRAKSRKTFLLLSHQYGNEYTQGANALSKTAGFVQSYCRADLCFMAFFFLFFTGLFKGSLMVQAVRGDWRDACEKTIRRSS